MNYYFFDKTHLFTKNMAMADPETAHKQKWIYFQVLLMRNLFSATYVLFKHFLRSFDHFLFTKCY